MDSCSDGVGERILRPSHLYITKSGPKKLNWAANTLLSKARPDSPPIPTHNIYKSRDGTQNQHYPRRMSSRLTLEEDNEVSQLRADVGIGQNRGLRDSQVSDSPPPAAGPSKTTTGPRRRASTLPSSHTPTTLPIRPRGHSSENVRTDSLDGIASVNSSGHFNNTGDEDTLETVMEHDKDDSSIDSSEDGDIESGFDDSVTNLLDSDPDAAMTDTDEDDLSGISEEDDSDIEEDLLYAARQLKLNAIAGDQGSMGSLSHAGSLHTSPQARRTHKRSDPKRQRSMDILRTSPTRQNGSRPRRMSTKSGNSDLFASPQPLFARADTDNSNASSNTGGEGSLASTLALASAHEKLEIGLGLRDPMANDSNPTLNGTTSVNSANSGANSGSNSASQSTRDRSESVLGPKLRGPIQTVSKASKLSTQIKAKQSTFDNPLEQYIAASGKSERRPVKLKMYMPTSDKPQQPWEVVVRGDANVHLAIGFSLYCYEGQKRTPPLAEDMKDANKWNLRIVEDDGEPDEDFPALDRTRLISAYSFDEFALVEATPEQVKANERLTPNVKKAAPATLSADAPPNQKVQQGDQGQQQQQQQEEEKVSKDIELRVFQYPFNEMVSQLFWTGVVDDQMYVEDLLEKVCAEKMLDSTMYAFKFAGTRVVVTNGTRLGSLSGQGDLELTPKRVITTANGFTTEPSQAPAGGKSNGPQKALSNAPNVYAALAMRGAEDARRVRTSLTSATGQHAALGIPEVLSAAGYTKYKIWRRQPMSFVGRHERILAIDGEYVHIMPSEDKTFFDSPKTSSFHIGQVIKCKQSSKVPSNFKVVVRKTSGPKRYDLEAPSPTQCAEIVAKLRTLANNYRNRRR